MVTREWVAVHRKHHQRCDKPGDPHSPHMFGIGQVVFTGAVLYSRAARDRSLLEEHGQGTPNDWIERCIYTPHNMAGIVLLLIIEAWVFGWWGLIMWLLQMVWIPFWAAGVVNGLGHWWGYRNFDTADHSTNLVPWGIIIGGEELHNNHHADPASARLSRRFWEFDAGWAWICLMKFLGLVKVKRC